jgi:transcriptional regulator with PAS, ATPase and Fis domain
LYQEVNETIDSPSRLLPVAKDKDTEFAYDKSTDSYEQHEEVEESLSLEDREKELIQKALEKHRGKRKYAAGELGISERTLYRKIKEYNLIDL